MKCILKRGSLRLRRPNGARDQFVLAATDLRDGPAKQEIWHGDAIAETAVETESSCRGIAWWWTQSRSNPSPRPNSPLTGKLTGNFSISRAFGRS